MSLYDDLGVPPDSSSEDIKKAFKSMAQRHHPDKGGDREKFELAKTAFDVLHDPEKRKRYDNTGKYSTQPEPTIEDMANQELCNLFKGAIEEGFEGDIIKRLTAITEDAIKMARKEIEKCKIGLTTKDFSKFSFFSLYLLAPVTKKCTVKIILKR